ncbi:MAG: hypothetical protein ACRDHP_05070 [Ktedonobacterales bacterium]
MRTQSVKSRPTRSSALTAPRALRPLAITTFFLLLAQFLIGMLVNFYVTIPSSHPGANPSNYFVGVIQGNGWALLMQGIFTLRLHVVLGLLLGLSAIALIWLAAVTRERAWIIASVVGFLGVLGAGFNGASFMNYGFDVSSLIMSIFFVIAVCAYAIGLYTTR